MYFNLTIRHYWRTVDYSEFYFLNQDGSLSIINNYAQDHDINFNAFNVDFMFSWNFAPGSYMNIMWKNQIFSNEIIHYYTKMPSFNENLSNLFKNDQTNSISLRLIYYFDWQYLKKNT